MCAASTSGCGVNTKSLRAARTMAAGCILFLGRCRILTRTLEASSLSSLRLWCALSLIPAIEHGSAAFCYSRQAIRVAFNCIKQQPIHPTCGPADTWSNFSLCRRSLFLVCVLMKPPKRNPRTPDRRLCQFCLIALTHLAARSTSAPGWHR